MRIDKYEWLYGFLFGFGVGFVIFGCFLWKLCQDLSQFESSQVVVAEVYFEYPMFLLIVGIISAMLGLLGLLIKVMSEVKK